MDYTQVFEISASGMRVQKTRLEVAAHNLANASTVTGPDGQPYQPLRVVSQAQPAGVAAASAFGALFDAGHAPAAVGGALARVVTDVTAVPRTVHEPGHPFADADGMVRYPGVNHLDQMMAITEALRAYEANVAAMQAARAMATRALDIGSGQ